MDQAFILQLVHAGPAYRRFFDAWIHFNNPDLCPTEEEFLTWPIIDNPFQEPHLSELLEIFPEAIATAKTKLQELRELEIKVDEDCGKRLQAALPADEFTSWLIYSPLRKIEEQKKHWEKIVKMHEFKRKPAGDDTINNNDVLRAKEYPIVSISKPNHAGFIRCPFHSEKTPSCKVFKDNRFHCFGCGADGDVIDFIMKQHNLTFIEAVKNILGK